MNKKLYYLNMHNNIEKLKVHGIHISGDYLCPLCMNVFNENEVMTILTEEDVPQCSLGGKRIALTCRKCNSTCGSEIDIQPKKGFLHLLIQDYVTSYLIPDMQVNLMRILKRLRNE